MKGRPHRLRNSIITSFVLVSVFLAFVYGLFIYQGIIELEDELFARQLQSQVDQYLRSLQDETVVDASGISIYLGTENMDQQLFERIGKYPPGYHEVRFSKPGQLDEEYHFIVKMLPNSSQRLYAVYDVGSLEISDAYAMKILELILLGGVLALGLACIVGWFVARRVSAPVEVLTAKIEKVSLDNLPVGLVEKGMDDEVSFLGRRLEEASQRIKDYIIREQQFTRNASHELRSPVTVIKGAVELLEAQYTQSATVSTEPLKRIKRAVVEMELLIETFLDLARNKEDSLVTTRCDLVTLCETAIEDLSYLIEDKPFTVRCETKMPGVVTAPAPVVSIVIKNILRNAFQHTGRGEVIVVIQDNTVIVQDTGKGIDPEMFRQILKQQEEDSDVTHQGFGLAIVDMICKRFGWELELQSDGLGTRVSLSFARHRRTAKNQ